MRPYIEHIHSKPWYTQKVFVHEPCDRPYLHNTYMYFVDNNTYLVC